MDAERPSLEDYAHCTINDWDWIPHGAMILFFVIKSKTSSWIHQVSYPIRTRVFLSG
jgi:hypothetical protein